MNIQSSYNSQLDKQRVGEWLASINLKPYHALFIENGYDSIKAIKTIRDKQELEDIGVRILGHRSVLYTEIKKLQNNEGTDGGDFYTTPMTDGPPTNDTTTLETFYSTDTTNTEALYAYNFQKKPSTKGQHRNKRPAYNNNFASYGAQRQQFPQNIVRFEPNQSIKMKPQGLPPPPPSECSFPANTNMPLNGLMNFNHNQRPSVMTVYTVEGNNRRKTQDSFATPDFIGQGFKSVSTDNASFRSDEIFDAVSQTQELLISKY